MPSTASGCLHCLSLIKLFLDSSAGSKMDLVKVKGNCSKEFRAQLFKALLV